MGAVIFYYRVCWLAVGVRGQQSVCAMSRAVVGVGPAENKVIFASKMAVKNGSQRGAKKKKNGKSNDLPFFFSWCGRWDLNP